VPGLTRRLLPPLRDAGACLLPQAVSVVAQLKTKPGVGCGGGGTLGAREGTVEPARIAFTAFLGDPYPTPGPQLRYSANRLASCPTMCTSSWFPRTSLG
jgi:hypothetical protein